METFSLHWADFLILAIALAVSLMIGVVLWRRSLGRQTNEDYVLGGRRAPLAPVVISLIVTYVSAVTMLGSSAEFYVHGAQVVFFFVGQALGVIIAAATTVPLLYDLKLTSADQYVQLRFASRTLTLGCGILQILILLLLGPILLVGTAYLFETMAGCPRWVSLLLLCILAAIYTYMGGYSAVLWTDVFQACIMLAGMAAVCIKGSMEVGDVMKVYREWDRHKLKWLPSINGRPDVLSLLANTVFFFGAYGCMQTAVQRVSSLPTRRRAIVAMLLLVPGIALVCLLVSGCGLVAFAYYMTLGCDPLQGRRINNPNQIVPLLVMDMLRIPTIPGLFAAAVLCGTLSSLSSTFSAIASLMWQDLGSVVFKKRANDERFQLLVSKVTVVVIAVVSLALGFGFLQFTGTLIELVIMLVSAFVTPLIVIFLSGMCFPRLNYRGALVGAIVAFIVVAWLTVGYNMRGTHPVPLPADTSRCNTTSRDLLSNTTTVMIQDFRPTLMPELYDLSTTLMPEHREEERGFLATVYGISYMYYCFFGFVISMIVVIILSFIPVFREDHPVDPRLLLPCFRPCAAQEAYSRGETIDTDDRYDDDLKDFKYRGN